MKHIRFLALLIHSVASSPSVQFDNSSVAQSQSPRLSVKRGVGVRVGVYIFYKNAVLGLGLGLVSTLTLTLKQNSL